jgi:flagellar biosynthetic protein FliP
MILASFHLATDRRATPRAGLLLGAVVLITVLLGGTTGFAEPGGASLAQAAEALSDPQQQPADPAQLPVPRQLPDLTSRDNLGPAIQMLVLLTVLSLAPAILVLCTSFTRIIIVLSLLRQALGVQNLPPNQVLAGLSLFMTCIVMAPTWGRINERALQPYLNGAMTQQQALAEGVIPLREFMIAQIDAAENSGTALMFLEYSRQPIPEDREPTWSDINTATLTFS